VVVALVSVVLRWSEPKREGALTTDSMNKPVSAPDLELLISPPQLSSCLRGGGRGDAMEARPISSYAASSILILEHISRHAWSGATARIDRVPASATVLLLLVEGRPSRALLAPFFHSGASSPDGRQFNSG
jgi:hypothetical protein